MRIKVIEGHPNYSVSDTGKVFNNKTGHELKPQDNGHGYGVVDLDRKKILYS